MKKILLPIGVLVIIIVVSFIGIKFIKVSSIQCISQNGQCGKNIISVVNTVNGKSIIDAYILLKKNLSNEKSISDYRIDFVLPFNYKVNVVERIPEVAYLLTNGNYALIDKDGIKVDEVKTTDLPKVTSSMVLNQNDLIYIDKLVHQLYTFYRVTSFKVTTDGLYLANLKGKQIIFPLEGDTEELLGALNLILSRLPSVKEASTIQVIDLRYKNPVLR